MKRTDWGYELKFLTPVLAWARTHLEPDPHADPALDGGYRISTLYFDTPDFTVFHRIGADRRRKYRVRRYGTETLLYLERKLKAGKRVRKFRSWIPDEELDLLAEGVADREWSGDWFRRRVRVRRLQPVCRVTYDRVARVGELEGQQVRLTIDRALRAAPAGGLCAPAAGDGIPLLAGQAILELKFPIALPQAYKELVRDVSIAPGSVSKYRIAVKSCQIKVTVTDPEPALRSTAGSAPQPRESGSRWAAAP
jgi:hypothetical protein